jgi:hypothetical protein
VYVAFILVAWFMVDVCALKMFKSSKSLKPPPQSFLPLFLSFQPNPTLFFLLLFFSFTATQTLSRGLAPFRPSWFRRPTSLSPSPSRWQSGPACRGHPLPLATSVSTMVAPPYLSTGSPGLSPLSTKRGSQCICTHSRRLTVTPKVFN